MKLGIFLGMGGNPKTVSAPAPYVAPTFVGRRGFGNWVPNNTTATFAINTLTGGSDATPSEGDWVFLHTAHRAGSLSVTMNSSGWTEISNFTAPGGNSTYNAALKLWGKKMGPTPDASVVLNFANSTFELYTCQLYVWRGVNATNPFDVDPVEFQGTGSPNPPAITPVTENTQVLCFGNSTGNFAGTRLLQSSDLDNFFAVSYFDSPPDILSAAGSKLFTGAAIDPAGWTNGETASTYGAAAVCIALRGTQ